MANGIKKDTFEKADQDTKFLIIFDLLADTNSMLAENVSLQANSCKERLTACDGRFAKIEGRKRIDTTLAGLLGFAGGFMAVLAKKLWE
jgi:hypothetical protein